MEEDIKIRPVAGKKIFIVPMIVCVFLIYYAVMSALAPGRMMKEMRNKFASAASPDEKINTEVYSDSTYLALLKEKSFLQSRTLMAETDSIYLVINLKDSTSVIEISGVAVHSAKISSYNLSPVISNGDRNTVLSILSIPMTIESSVASIRKEPVMIKIAPKDTSEYKPDIIPDTSVVEPVNYILEMSGGTKIYVYQDENENPADIRSNFIFDLKDRIRNTWSAIKRIVAFKVPEYQPYIKIRIPREDGKIIYRALPVNGQVAIYT